MFAQPEAADLRTTAKADPTAPARSSIRRQRTVRYSPNTRAHPQTSSSLSPRRPASGSRGTRQPVDRISLLEDIHRRNRNDDGNTDRRTSAEAMMSEIYYLEAALGQGNSLLSRAANGAHAEATHRSRVENRPIRLSVAPNYESLTGRTRIGNDLPGSSRAAPEARSPDNTTFGNVAQTSSPTQYIPTPPFSSEEPPTQQPLRSSALSLGNAAYTPGFAPAHRLDARYTTTRMVELASVANQIRDLRMSRPYHREPALESLLSEINSLMARNPTELSQDDLLIEAACVYRIRAHLDRLAVEARSSRSILTSYDTDFSDLPPLRRMSQQGPEASRSPARPGHRDDLDGLGDRERSFSPEAAVSWETMLTTIQPDLQVPSTHSSFTSAPTSASDTSNGSSSATNSSYGTQLTSLSDSVSVEACPTLETSSPGSDYQNERRLGSVAQQRRHLSAEFLSRADEHFDRITSLSRRVNQQRSRGENLAQHRRIVDREMELHRIEAALQRLERQTLEDLGATSRFARSNDLRAGRERL